MEWRGNKEDILAAVKRDWKVLSVVSEAMRADRDIVLAAISCDADRLWKFSGKALEFASQSLRDDPKVVFEAVCISGEALRHASARLACDRRIVLQAVSGWGDALQYASEGLRADRDVALAAVSSRCTALQWAAEELRGDCEVVTRALASECFFSGLALRYASEALRADKSIVLKAVCKNSDALEFAAAKLRSDREVVLAAVSRTVGPFCRTALKFASAELQGDRGLVLEAVVKCGDALQFASSMLRSDRKLVLTAVSQSATALQYAMDPLLGELLEEQAFLDEYMNAHCIFRLSLLSGRSCILVVPQVFIVRKQDMLLEAARLLELEDPQRLSGSELLLGTEPLPDVLVPKTAGLLAGKVTDLQLLASKRRRLA